MSYEAIIFDMGDIFYDATPWRRALAADLAARGVDIDYPRLVPIWERHLVPVYVGKKAYWDAFREMVAAFGIDRKTSATIESNARQQAKRAANAALFDGVEPSLKTLSQNGVKLAVRSDTESTGAKVRSRVKRFRIEHYFDAVVTSYDIGHVKPEPEAFLHALRALESHAAGAAFVGHDLDEMIGAREVGLDVIGYNTVHSAHTDHMLETFSDVVSLALP